MVTLYDTLGVREDATDEEIKRAYRKAAMRSHPDRNVGREAAAHATFQQIKEAYGILSDPAQRRVYDAVFAEEMRRLQPGREEERLRAEREAAAREAEYAAFVTLALRLAERGHNRDVMFGALIGRDCDDELAARIADSVAALYAARAGERSQASEQCSGMTCEPELESEPAGEVDADANAERERKAEAQQTTQHAHAGLFNTLWHGVFGLRV
jgi:DnaJ-class molecular chaperone